jgi:uncharacterized protein YggE
MSMKIKPIQLAGILTIWIFAVGLIVTFNNHSIRTQVSPRYVNVVGDGTVKVTPDSVHVDASVSSVAASSAASLAATAKSADSMRTSLKGSGVEAKYIKALNLSTNPEYSYPNNGPAKLTGYRSTQSFSIVIRDAKNAGMIIQNAQSSVGNSLSINSTSPYVFDQKMAEASARTLAIASAKAKAQSYAELTGSKLGKVLSIDEQITQSNPMPLMAVAKSMDASAAPVRVDLGHQDITINVTTKWELK